MEFFSELKFELHSEEREGYFKILAGNENDIIRKDELDMCALGGKKASSETSDETSVVIKEQVFVLFCLLFGKGLEYLDRNSGKKTEHKRQNRFKVKVAGHAISLEAITFEEMCRHTSAQSKTELFDN